MARDKGVMETTANAGARQVWFKKRRKCVFKKAKELSVLCGADVALTVFSQTDKLYEFCNTNMNLLLDRYERHVEGEDKEPRQENEGNNSDIMEAQQKLTLLESRKRQLLGEDLQGFSLNELQSMECKIEATLNQVRSCKMQLLAKNINELQNKLKYKQETDLSITKNEN